MIVPMQSADVEVERIALTAGDIAAINLDSARRRSWNRFWRAPQARSMPGSGLGLSIVRRVVDDHHGQVTIDTSAGGGTRVRISLPAAVSMAAS